LPRGKIREPERGFGLAGKVSVVGYVYAVKGRRVLLQVRPKLEEKKKRGHPGKA